ncbi:MAG: hypothetical protein AAF417_18615 [Pseudomonadota bacterium]
MSGKNVLLIGLGPSVVSYSRRPGLTAEKLEARLRREEAALNQNGYAASICFIDQGETAEDVVRARLAETDFACVLVGAGVRSDADEFLLFEKLVRVVHERAPKARVCFNLGSADSTTVVKHWV